MDKADGKAPALAAAAIALAALLVFAMTRPPAQLSADSQVRPYTSVILITFDALRADRLGARASSGNLTPNLDSFAEKSLVFTDSMSQCGSTICSLPSMLTSTFPRIDDMGGARSLAEIIRESGYSTYAVVSHEKAESAWGTSAGFDVFDENYTRPGHGAETTERVLGILRGSGGRPFFLWVHYREPHSPYCPPKEKFESLYPNPQGEPTVYGSACNAQMANDSMLEPVRSYYETHRSETAQRFVIFGKGAFLTPTMVSQYRALYDGNVEEADMEFSRLMDGIGELGLSASTAVIVSSDHGETMGAHDAIDHNNLYYSGLHVPLIVRLPDGRHGVSAYPAMGVDIQPTILGILNVKYGGEMRGVNLLGNLSGERLQYAGYKYQKTVKLGRYKLIFSNESAGAQLFDVLEDPEELNDIIGSHQSLADGLINSYEAIASPAYDSQEEDTLELLRSLGYAQ
jgi:arylsulfatase